MKKTFIFLLSSLSLLISCNPTTDVFEKNITIPGYQWESSFQPVISFAIQDTSALYNLSLVLRHTDAYNYNNIWIKGTMQEPGDTASKSKRYNITLAENNKGWLGSGMDDVFENRSLIQPQTHFNKPGVYRFTIEQIMREDPLAHILNVGIRVEKAK